MLPSRRSWNISHQCGHKWLWWTGKKPLIYAYSDPILSYGKNGQQNVRLVSKHCCKTSSDVHVVPPTLKPVFQQIRLWQVAWILTTDWMKLRGIMGITSLAVKQVRVGSVKRATCTDFVAKSRTTFDFRQQFCATCDNLICCKKGLNVGGKTRKIVFPLVLL